MLQDYRCVPKIASPEALNNFTSEKNMLVYLKSPRRKR